MQTLARPKVLFVDDESNCLSTLQRLLRQENFEIFTTNSPFEALHLASQESFSVVVSDQKMPIMQGTEILEKIREISPFTIRIMLTAHADLQIAVEAINRGNVYKLFFKPWNDDELKECLQQAIAQFELIQKSQAIQKTEALVMASGVEVVKEPPLQDEGKLPLAFKQEMAKKYLLQMEKINHLALQLHEANLNSVRALAKMSKMQHKPLGFHCERVAALTKKLAAFLNYPEDRFQLEAAALLHDIGKASLPPDLLQRSEKTLTNHERAVLQSYPLQGEAIIGLIPLLKPAAKLVCHHQEFYNGKGYPDGLAGHKIPLGSRIIAVVDAYDMVRYALKLQPVTSHQLAMAKLENLAGTMLDPEILEALSECIQPKSKALESDPLKGESASKPRPEQPGVYSRTGADPSKASPNNRQSVVSSQKSPAPNGPTKRSTLPRTEGPQSQGRSPDTAKERPWWLDVLYTQETIETSSASVSSRPPARAMPLPLESDLVQIEGVPSKGPVTAKELSIHPRLLSVGMVLSRDLVTPKGVKLLPAGTVIKKQYLAVLQNFLVNQHNQEIFILKDKILPDVP